MPLKRNFVEKGIQFMQIQEFLGKVLTNSGYAGIDMQKNPLGMRITIKTARPGLVIGRKGMRIRELSEAIASKFGIENPQIDVEPVEVPELNGQIMAEAIAFGIKKGQNYRKSAYSVMRRVIKSGARGIEVKVAGKSTSQRAKTLSFRAGVISKCGDAAEKGVSRGCAEAILKTGVIGVRVRIMPLDFKLPDEILLRDQSGVKSLKPALAVQELEGAAEVVIDKDSSVIIEEDEEEEETIFDAQDEKNVSSIELEDIEKVESKKKTEDTPVETKKEVKKAAPKKDEPKKEEPKTEEPKTEEPKKEETLGEIVEEEGKKEKKEKKKKEKKKKEDKE